MYKSLKPDFLINSGIKPLQRYVGLMLILDAKKLDDLRDDSN